MTKAASRRVKKTSKSRSKKQARPAKELLAWYQKNARSLPWRQTRDPYKILVSEVMLQQTQVDRVLPFYQHFMELFPDEQTLAVASDDVIHRAWKGLGYPSRVERLRAACRHVLAAGGTWPSTPEGLQELPGIGPYTAGAVACFAFGAAVPLVDTNVARVYARRDALSLPIDRSALWTHAAEQVDAVDPIQYNNALMELGALVCTARTPGCATCPWKTSCQARDTTQRILDTANPLKAVSKKIRYGDVIRQRSKPHQHIVLALIHHEGLYLVAQRKKTQHLGNYWELPGGKREPGEADRTAIAREVQEELSVDVLSARHILTFHYDYGDRYLIFHLYRCRVFHPEKAQPVVSRQLRWVTPAEFVELDFPPANKPIIERMRRYHRLQSAQ